MAREPKIIIATGTRGVGKTFKTCQTIEKYITPNQATGKEGRKVLIFDVNMEYTNEEMAKHGFRFRTKVLALKDLPKWVKQKRIEVRRILPVDASGNPIGVDKMADILNVILHYYRGGMLILEDINRYLIETKDAHVIGALATNRHRDMDIIIHLQSLSPVTTRMFQNCNAIRFHYQTDDVQRIAARLPNYELFKVAQLLVNNQYFGGNERFYCQIQIDKNKLNGKFSKRMFVEACRQYIEQHPKQLNTTMLKYGKGYEARLKAMKDCVRDLYVKYYGNEEQHQQAA